MLTQETSRSTWRTNFMPDPELLIRTGGEFRISNYLFVADCLFRVVFLRYLLADFKEEGLHKAIAELPVAPAPFWQDRGSGRSRGREVINGKKDEK